MQTSLQSGLKEGMCKTKTFSSDIYIYIYMVDGKLKKGIIIIFIICYADRENISIMEVGLLKPQNFLTHVSFLNEMKKGTCMSEVSILSIGLIIYIS